jgi:hypothetical protein
MPSVIYPVERDACVDESPPIIPPATAPLLPISDLLPDVHVAFSRCLCFANDVSFHHAANAPPQTGGTRTTLGRHSGDTRATLGRQPGDNRATTGNKALLPPLSHTSARLRALQTTDLLAVLYRYILCNNQPLQLGRVERHDPFPPIRKECHHVP